MKPNFVGQLQDTLLPLTSGSLLVAQFDSGEKPIMVFGIVPKSVVHQVEFLARKLSVRSLLILGCRCNGEPDGTANPEVASESPLAPPTIITNFPQRLPSPASTAFTTIKALPSALCTISRSGDAMAFLTRLGHFESEFVAFSAEVFRLCVLLNYNRARDKGDKSLELYKFYVNALYVAMTRAVDSLTLVESDTTHPLLDLLGLKVATTNAAQSTPPHSTLTLMASIRH